MYVEPAATSDASLGGVEAHVYAHAPRLGNRQVAPGARVHVNVHLAVKALQQAVKSAGDGLVGAVRENRLTVSVAIFFLLGPIPIGAVLCEV